MVESGKEERAARMLDTFLKDRTVDNMSRWLTAEAACEQQCGNRQEAICLREVARKAVSAFELSKDPKP